VSTGPALVISFLALKFNNCANWDDQREEEDEQFERNFRFLLGLHPRL
jgi:hypothetical protein